MLDIGWTELLLIGVVALIVVGPKDLPGMFRALGKFTGKMRRMARDFQRAMDDAADESGVRETAADLKKMTSSKNLGLDSIKAAADKFEKWQPPKPTLTGGENTQALREKRAAETQAKIAEARAAREAKAEPPPAPAAPPPKAAAAPAHAPEPARERVRPGEPVARAARPKNMPKKKPSKGRA